MMKNIPTILVGASILALSSAALAEPPTPQSANDSVSDREIVVTGTLLRGVAPVGSPIISVGQQKAVESGATTSNELLATIPQVTNFFNAVPSAQLAIAVNQLQVARPNLRSLSGPNAASSATLVLVDGHRVAGVGVNQSTIDPELIPNGAIERVEVVTDGGSATYGADAVGGVINFITRKRFDGLKVDGRYGFADDYYTVDTNVTTGKDWGSGSLYASYNFNKNDAIFGRDRDYIRGIDYSNGTFKGRQCSSPNVALPGIFLPQFNFTLPGASYAYPNGGAGSFNQCDPTDHKSFVPAAERHSGLVSLHQELNDAVTADVKLYYSDRRTRGTDALYATATLTTANPYLFVPAGQARPAQETVDFSFAPLLGVDSAPFGTGAQEWGANAEFTVALDDNWQVRTLLNYSRSNSSYYLSGYDAAALTAAGADSNPATALNPFNQATNSPAVIAAIRNSASQGQARDEIFNGRSVVDGSLLTLPGGDVRVAAGYEFIRQNFQQRTTTGAFGALAALPFAAYSRSVHALFGEVQVPVFGEDNARPGLYSLILSASGRYDHYSDFGSTFNPKIGATFKPADWITIRGNWGTSFTAPTPLDQLGSQRNTISSFPFIAFTKPGETPPSGAFAVALQGSTAGLKPQEAETWSVGVDLTPIPGLRASANYYDVNFEGILSTPVVDGNIIANYPDQVRTKLTGFTPAELLAFGSQAPGGIEVVQTLINNGTLVYELVDFRVANFGILHTKGIDFQLNYRRDTSFGGFDIALNGNRPLSRKARPSSTSPVLDQLDTENPKLYLQATIGANVGALRAEATLNHTGGYDIVPTTSVPVQDHVGAFNTVDLFFKYDIPGDSPILRDLSLTLNVRNLLDQSPPLLFRTSVSDKGFANGFSLGRMFILGASKKF
jgi:iron complex outermembrane recepter protein